MPDYFDPIVNGEEANAATFNAPLLQLDAAIAALASLVDTDITALENDVSGIKSGSSAMASPQITSFANSTHDHTDAANGGKLPFDSLDTGAATDGQFLRVQSGAVVAETVAVPDGIPSGTINMFGGSSAPSGWLLCDGSAVSRATYSALFTAIGTTYGVGDGSTTFNLPDMRGRVAAGLDNMGGSSANRVTNASADSLGGAVGAETHTLTNAQVPANVTTTDAGFGGNTIVKSTAHAASAASSHNNMQPTIFLNFVIKT